MPTGLRSRFREGAGAGAFPSIPRSSLLAPSASKLRRTKVALGSARYSEAASALAMIRSQCGLSAPLLRPFVPTYPYRSMIIVMHRSLLVHSLYVYSKSRKHPQPGAKHAWSELSPAQEKWIDCSQSNWVGFWQIMPPSLAHLSSPTLPPEPPFPFLELER